MNGQSLDTVEFRVPAQYLGSCERDREVKRSAVSGRCPGQRLVDGGQRGIDCC